MSVKNPFEDDDSSDSEPEKESSDLPSPECVFEIHKQSLAYPHWKKIKDNIMLPAFFPYHSEEIADNYKSWLATSELRFKVGKNHAEFWNLGDSAFYYRVMMELAIEKERNLALQEIHHSFTLFSATLPNLIKAINELTSIMSNLEIEEHTVS